MPENGNSRKVLKLWVNKPNKPCEIGLRIIYLEAARTIESDYEPREVSVARNVINGAIDTSKHFNQCGMPMNVEPHVYYALIELGHVG